MSQMKKKKKIRFYCESCGCPYELCSEECSTYSIKSTGFLRQKITVYGVGLCPRCKNKNIEEIKIKGVDYNVSNGTRL